MTNLTRYGTARPAEIAAKVAALQTRFMPFGAPVEPAAPVEAPAVDPKAERRAKVQAQQIERADLRIQRAELREYRQAGEVCAELERIEARLQDLDDYLIFEPDCDFEATPFDDYDEFDADLPDEIDGSFSSDFSAVQ